MSDWMRRMREAFADRQQPAVEEPTAPADPYLDALTHAQLERRIALRNGNRQARLRWDEEVAVLSAMGPVGFATLRQGVEPTDFMAEATEEAEADAEADNVLTIEFDEDGRPWCWAPEDWTDERILGVLRQCAANYEDTSEDHL